MSSLPLLLSSAPLRPSASHAASVSYDFDYRLERALDPEKRGPASGDYEYDSPGSNALDAMCNPAPPRAEEDPPARMGAGNSTAMLRLRGGMVNPHALRPALQMTRASCCVRATAPSPVRSGRALGGLAAIGAIVGPFVDALHNGVLLRYNMLPVSVSVLDTELRSSLLIPPLLALTYVVLGAVLPSLFNGPIESRVGRLPQLPLAPTVRAGLAVLTTIAIVVASKELVQLDLSSSPVDGRAILYTAGLVQWALLDGTPTSLLLAALVSIAGPLAELPFTYLGAWTYTSADLYYPLAPFGYGAGTEWAALDPITAPCYWAVTLDAIALGRWLAGEAVDEEELELKQTVEVLEQELAGFEEEKAAGEVLLAAVTAQWSQKRERLSTDFDKFKARHSNATIEAQVDAKVRLVTSLLPLTDNLERAKSAISVEGEAQQAVADSYAQMYDELQATLIEMGVERIPTVGEEFDYNLHMAIQQVPSDEYDEGVVIEEVQPGYTCQGKLVRAASVLTSAGY